MPTTRQSQRIRVKAQKEAEAKAALHAQQAKEVQDKSKGEELVERSFAQNTPTHNTPTVNTPSQNTLFTLNPSPTHEEGGTESSKALPIQAASSFSAKRIGISTNTSSKVSGRKRKTLDATEGDQESAATAVSIMATSKPKRKYTRRNKALAKREGDLEENAAKPTRQHTKRKKVDESGGEAPKPKRKYTKRKAIEEGKSDTQETAVKEVGSKKKRTTSNKGKEKAVDEQHVDNDSMGDNNRELIPVNPHDPCSAFPTELWHTVLDFLPLSVIATTAVVSNTWLTAARTYHGWMTAAEKGKMGSPKIKYKSWMALVCAHSYFVCDRCLDYSIGKGRASRVPLPVEVENNKDPVKSVWHLCWTCRNIYYTLHPEPLRKPCNPDEPDTFDESKRITKGRSLSQYALKDEDLASLPCLECRNPHVRSAAPMLLYDEVEVQETALDVHAGWVGVTAAAGDRLKKKREAFKKRQEDNRVRVSTKPKKVKPPKEPKPRKRRRISSGRRHGFYGGHGFGHRHGWGGFGYGYHYDGYDDFYDSDEFED
ncbi:hypothetical protein BGZ52_004115 [Haplosporangium bisporale]|nr:hypothetical protein BGZ52_004115 [Haplosporangium bisporale]